MTAPSSRRALLCGLAMLPAAPASLALAAPPSSLAQACLWAIEQRAWIDAAAGSENWTNERLDEESGKADAIFSRAIEEPSAGLADLNAKARLALEDFLRFAQPMNDPDENPALDDGQRIVVTVLREVIALCG